MHIDHFEGRSAYKKTGWRFSEVANDNRSPMNEYVQPRPGEANTDTWITIEEALLGRTKDIPYRLLQQSPVFERLLSG